ncbi:MAG TPA: J domain-containing protein [Blastocatellia bacterium]|jgi:hypothetical protein
MTSHYDIVTEAAGRFLTVPASASINIRARADGVRLIRVRADDRDTVATLIGELKNCIPPMSLRYSRKAGGWVVSSDSGVDQWLRIARNWRYVLIMREHGDWDDDDDAQRPIAKAQMQPADAFRTLHLLDSAPPEVVRAAYKALALLHHPDAGGDQEQMTAINLAYEVLRSLR